MDLDAIMPVLTPLRVYAWLAGELSLDNPFLREVLTDRYGDRFDPATATITIPRLATATDEGLPAWGSVHLEVCSPSRVEMLDPAPEGVMQPAQAVAALAVHESVPGHLDPDVRVEALTHLMDLIDEQLAPLAWYIPSVQASIVDRTAPGMVGGGLLRRRVLPVDNVSDAWTIDSVGGEPFGLVDLECRVRGLDPDFVASHVDAMAEQLLRGQLILHPGDPVVMGTESRQLAEGGVPTSVFLTAEPGTSAELPMRSVARLIPEERFRVDAGD